MRIHPPIRIGVFVGVVCVVLGLLAGAPAMAQDKLPDSFQDKVPLLSSVPMFIAAEQLAITTVQGKDITAAGDPPGNAKAKKLTDVGIGTTSAHENEPSAVANAKDRKKLVAANHLFPAPGGVRCVTYHSEDNGATWSSGTLLTQISGQCSDPVLAYAPDGSRVYAAYMDIVGANWDILVSHSDDNGVTWSAPVIALDGNPAAFVYDKPWIDTHELDDSQSAYV